MASANPDNRPDSSGSQGKYVAAPRNVVQLLDLAEIRERWGYGEDRVYRAVARGRLRAYGRPGHQKYYSEAELIAVFGEPPSGPDGRPAKLSRSDNGRNQQSFDLDELAAA